MSQQTRTYSFESIQDSLQKGKDMTGLEYLQAMMLGELSPAPAVQSLGMYGISCKEGEAIFGFVPEDYHYNAVGQFAKVSNPGVRVFVDKMDDMIQIYNHTAEICFDNEKIYLITG